MPERNVIPRPARGRKPSGLAFHATINYSNGPNMASPALVIDARYQIPKEPVGQGGMGIVYKAYDVVTKRHVALKTMRGALDLAALELFSKEWTLLSRLNHPNIVDIFDTGEFEDEG